MNVPMMIENMRLIVVVNKLKRSASTIEAVCHTPAIQPGMARHSRAARGTSSKSKIRNEASPTINQYENTETISLLFWR